MLSASTKPRPQPHERLELVPRTLPLNPSLTPYSTYCSRPRHPFHYDRVITDQTLENNQCTIILRSLILTILPSSSCDQGPAPDKVSVCPTTSLRPHTDFKARNKFFFAWSNFANHCLCLRSNFNNLISNSRWFPAPKIRGSDNSA